MVYSTQIFKMRSIILIGLITCLVVSSGCASRSMSNTNDMHDLNQIPVPRSGKISVYLQDEAEELEPFLRGNPLIELTPSSKKADYIIDGSHYRKVIISKTNLWLAACTLFVIPLQTGSEVSLRMTVENTTSNDTDYVSLKFKEKSYGSLLPHVYLFGRRIPEFTGFPAKEQASIRKSQFAFAANELIYQMHAKGLLQKNK